MTECKEAGLSMLNTPLTDWTVLDKLIFTQAYNDHLSDKLGHAEGARTLENYYRQEYANKIDRLDTGYSKLKQMSEWLLAYLLETVKAAAPPP